MNIVMVSDTQWELVPIIFRSGLNLATDSYDQSASTFMSQTGYQLHELTHYPLLYSVYLQLFYFKISDHMTISSPSF